MGTAYRPLLERVLDSVDLIVAGSPNMVEHSPLLRPRADKVRVVPYGIDVASTPPRPSASNAPRSCVLTTSVRSSCS